MNTRLIELKNSRDLTLRGILIQPVNSSSETVLICVAGFAGLSSTAPKFISLTQELLSLSAPSPVAAIFRYDPTGIGLSDGKYHLTNIDTLVDDLSHSMNYLLKYFKEFIFIGHSLGTCIIARYLESQQHDFKIAKIILLAPALNQYGLHRYWYMQQIHGYVTWTQSEKEFCESDFQEYLAKKSPDAFFSHGAHKIFYEFIRRCSKEDFSFKFNSYEHQLLHIHGNGDLIVPLQSIKHLFKNTIILNTDDHDLEEPEILHEWTMKAVEFIYNNQ